MGDLLGVSVTGLRLSQSALSTVGHNIANANTEGYSRQRVEPVTNPATAHPNGHIGNGVNVESVERIVNQFVVGQMREDSTLFSGLDEYYSQVSQLDNLLSDEVTGLSGSLNSFFAAMQNGSDDPTSIPARQLIISEADNLAGRFNSIYGRFTAIEQGVRDGMEVAVSSINSLATNVAKLNSKISEAFGLSNNGPPNDLLDQREQALKELSSLIPIQVFDQGQGQLNVAVAHGQTLVIGPEARGLTLLHSDQDPSEYDLAIVGGGSNQVITSGVKGGELGGMIRFRDSILDTSYNSLGQIAVVLADTVNTFHGQGVNLDNEFGGDFFYDINNDTIASNRVIVNSENNGSKNPILKLHIRDSQQVVASDYSVSIEGGGSYRVTRNSDSVDVASGLLPSQKPFSVEFDGMELEFLRGDFEAGDSLLLKPVAFAAQDFSVAIQSPDEIAFASPMLTNTSLGNTGSGAISSGEVISLVDKNLEPLPLFATEGEMSPPLVVRFNSATSYDVLDNRDPGNPVQLQPPIREQRFVPGVSNLLFSDAESATTLSTHGDMVGLPDGKQAVTQAALFAANSAPDFTQTDFSGAAAFNFDVTVQGTVGGSNDGLFNVVVDSGAITDQESLVNVINAQLSSTDARAYITDVGGIQQLAFRLNTPGYGNVDLAYTGPAGNLASASNLMGIDFNLTYSTDSDADGIEGVGFLTNGYLAESIAITRPNPIKGAQPITTNLFTRLNASAKETASMLSNVPGVEANAFNYIEISDFQLSGSTPLQIKLNGEDLLEYSDGNPAGLAPDVPDPATEADQFYQYIAERINENETLQSQSVYAVAAADSFTGDLQLRVYSSEGEDFNVALTAQAGDAIAVSDGDHGAVSLVGSGDSVSSQVVVGGRMDVSLSEGLELTTFPPVSMLFGDTRAEGFAKNSYLGIQASISGNPQAGDTFNIGFNSDAASDNRNGLRLVGLQTAKTMSGGIASFNQSYGTLVESAGVETHSSKINRDAAEQVLEQTEALRNSISGVNLDEEAADLIRFEQLFSANAQVISVARDIFDRLISAF